jgi:hypothetical protein
MNGRSLWKYIPPPGPVFSILLIGLVLLSAVLYYRAVKIQRFLEPALALSQPRNEFAKNINSIFQKEFGQKSISGLKVKSGSILIDQSLLFSTAGRLTAPAQEDIRKLARIFLALMKDEHTRSEISLVLIIARFPSYGPRGANEVERKRVQHMVGSIQDALFRAEPELGIRYSTYFAGTALPTNPHEGKRDLLELRIVPSEYLHVEVLEKLEKYSY